MKARKGARSYRHGAGNSFERNVGDQRPELDFLD